MNRRFSAGLDYTFRWVPPRPDAWAQSAQLTIHWPAGDESAALSVRSEDEISAVSADRRRLTVTWGTSNELVADGSSPMPAWISFGPSAQIPVRVLRVVSYDETGGILELSEPLPHEYDVGGALEWQIWQDSRTAPALVQGPVRWSVEWSSVIGGVVGDWLTDEGVLWVVRAPFSTGLTTQRLVASSPWLANMVPPGQSSWAPQIEIAQDSLITRINARLNDGQSVNDVTGGQFRNAHALETRLLILRGMQEAGASKRDQIEQIERDLTAELDRIWQGGIDWLDANGDGVLDAGEAGAKPGRVSLRAFTSSTQFIDAAASDAVTRTPFDRRRSDDWGSR